MMRKRRSDVALFITDQFVSFFERQSGVDHPSYGIEYFEKNAIENGYIKEPENVLITIKTLFQRFNVKPRTITLAIHDQNILIRDVKIKLEDLDKKTIEQYLDEQRNKTLHYPYSNPVVTHFIREQNEQTIRVIALITDGDLLHAYYDVFDRLKAKEVKYEIASIPFYNMYTKEIGKLDDIVMFVNMYKGMFSIQIVENGFPIFNMIEESEGGMEDYALMVENYVERIANYYKFNLRKGKKSIDKVLVFNIHEEDANRDLEVSVIKRLGSFNAQLCNLKIEENNFPNACIIPYAMMKGEAYRTQDEIEFNLKRISKKTVLGHQIMVLSMAIIIFVLLVYIPYYALEEEKRMAQNQNNVLQIQLDMLREETEQPIKFPVDQTNYNASYDYISAQEYPFTPYLLDLLDSETATVLIRSYQVDTKLKQIKVVIQGTNEQELYEYVLVIYEAYGIIDQKTDKRWIEEEPTYRLTLALTMEVTIQYA